MELPTNTDAEAATTDSATQQADSSQATQDQNQGVQQASSPAATKEPTSLDEVGEQFGAGSPEEGAADAPGQEASEQGGEATEGVGADAAASEKQDDQDEEDAEASAEADPSLTDPTKPPPFHEHPRWQEVVAERDALKPLAEEARTLHTYMAQNNISPDDFQGMLEIGALMQSNPEEAYRRLEPILSGLGQLVGRTLPADLEQEVAAGKITPAVAQELARTRAQNRMLQQQRQQDAQRHQQSSQQALGAAVSGWVAQKTKTDLAFKPGSPLWEAVNDRLVSLSTAKPPKNPTEAAALVERAYTEVKKWFAAPVAAKATVAKTKSLSSNGSSAVQKTKEPETLEEVAMQATGLRWAVPKKGI